uniref:Uncharacterized protein n=1 Tax=Glossina austeni TaxID=7395 RepID=A0A1A9V0F4_GLOAU
MGKGIEFYQNIVKPVHPTKVSNHGLFGFQYVKQHMMTADDLWTPASLTDEFAKMTDLLRKRLQFSNLEKVSQRKRLFHHYCVLKRQIRHGRRKWVQMIYDDDFMKVRNILAGNKAMQRLYRTMSLNQIVDNIDQRTFNLRKERDRLTARLENLKADYEKALGEIDNRNTYHDFYVLDEQFKSYGKKKLLHNSQTRLAAIKTINGSYQKIIAILRYDAIFYEPILNSLDKDILDQENFIKHILHLGSPAIARFSELSEDFRPNARLSRLSFSKSITIDEEFSKSFEKLKGKRCLKRVELLEEAIEAQDKYQANILDYMKNRAKAFVLFRYALWNIHDILRHVAPSRGRPAPYPNEYLKLPLLKFEMLTMRAVPPEAFEDNISTLMKQAERKLREVMIAFYQLRVKPNQVSRARADYQSDYIYRQELLASETNSSWTKQEFIVAEEAAKTTSNVPNRKQIKAQSAKFVEETLKRDE